MAKTRKVSRIAVGGEGSADLFVLCDDHTVWRRIAVRKGGVIVDWTWEQIKVNLPDVQ